jgi:hypothetical protein
MISGGHALSADRSITRQPHALIRPIRTDPLLDQPWPEVTMREAGLGLKQLPAEGDLLLFPEVAPG